MKCFILIKSPLHTFLLYPRINKSSMYVTDLWQDYAHWGYCSFYWTSWKSIAFDNSTMLFPTLWLITISRLFLVLLFVAFRCPHNTLYSPANKDYFINMLFDFLSVPVSINTKLFFIKLYFHFQMGCMKFSLDYTYLSIKHLFKTSQFLYRNYIG